MARPSSTQRRIGAGLLLLVLPFVAASAWALPGLSERGDPVDFTPGGTQPGLDFGLEPVSGCSDCHAPVDGDATDLTQMPEPTWFGSMKANAARDPLFWAALDIANNDVPGVGDFCLRCHAPYGWYEGRVHKTGPGAADPVVNGQDGCQLSGDFVTGGFKDDDYSGVTCHYCHRIDPRGPGGEPFVIGNANTWIDDQNCDADNFLFGPCRKGPASYAQADQPPHAWSQSAFFNSSELCGTCHEVSSPTTSAGILKTLILEDGTDTGRPFPMDRTYSEWLNSSYAEERFGNDFESGERIDDIVRQGRTCQDCHLKTSDSPDARACTFDEPGFRTDELKLHQFVGGNTWIPAVLKGEYGGPTGLDREQAFDQTIAWAQQLLTEESAEITLQLDPVDTINEQLVANVRVTNLSGHKLPTGYVEGRRMWLNVQARDAKNALIWESGAYDAATGVLTTDSQIKVYESLHGEWNATKGQCETTDMTGRKVFHQVLGNCIAKDNRIPPLGFTGSTNPELAPVAYSYPETTPGSGVLVNYDDTAYTIPVPMGTQLPVTVTARLRYQTSSREYIEFLKTEAEQPGAEFPSENELCGTARTIGPADQTRGAYMHALWENYGRSAPVDMVSATEGSSTKGGAAR